MAKKEAMWVKVSGWLFILGIAISVIAGLAPALGMAIMDSATTTGLLAALGFIIGVLVVLGVGSIDKQDFNMFLLAVVAMMAAGGAGSAFMNVMYVGPILADIVNNIGILVVPAAVLIALKAIWKSAQTKF